MYKALIGSLKKNIGTPPCVNGLKCSVKFPEKSQNFQNFSTFLNNNDFLLSFFFHHN
jgi:hypothetical protein